MDKPSAILLIYDTLLEERPLTIDEISKNFECSRRTSLRYIKNVRKYLLQYHHKTVAYDRKKNTFIVKDPKKKKEEAK